MLDTTKVLPPTVAPPTRPLSILQSIRAARRNVLEIIPELAYRQPMLSGRMGSRWHMVQNPGALRRVLLDNVENYPKSEVMLRMLRPAVGDSLFTSEGDSWRWQRRAVAPVFAQRNVTALAPVMTATAERAAERLMRRHIYMRVPRSIAAAGVANLNEADALFHHPARQQ